MGRFATRVVGALATGAAILALAAPAQAATYDLDLSGVVADGSYSSFDKYRFFNLTLAGADTPFALQVGDVLNLTVTLDAMLSVPPGTDTTFFGVSLRTNPEDLASAPDNGVSSSSSVTFLNGDLAGETFYSGCGNCLSGSMSTAPNQSFAVSKFLTSITIENLISPDPEYTGGYEITRFELGYQATDLSAPVPEPGEWAMMAAGLVVAGAVARRRRTVRAA